MVSSMDLAPTILELANIEVLEEMGGYSMSDWCLKGEGKERELAYIGLYDDEDAWRGIWDGRYLYSEMRYKVLFDHKNDPYEMNNLWDDPNHAKIKEQLHNQLVQKAKEIGDPIVSRLEN
jgi:arylsulfatase A-like enzyme